MLRLGRESMGALLKEGHAEQERYLKTPAGKRAARRERWEEKQAVWRRVWPQRAPKNQQERCGARCRDGHPCKAPRVWDPAMGAVRNGRCRMHGGLSTGPRTPEGKARVAAAARRMMLERWRAKRAPRADGTENRRPL